MEQNQTLDCSKSKGTLQTRENCTSLFMRSKAVDLWTGAEVSESWTCGPEHLCAGAEVLREINQKSLGWSKWFVLFVETRFSYSDNFCWTKIQNQNINLFYCFCQFQVIPVTFMAFSLKKQVQANVYIVVFVHNCICMYLYLYILVNNQPTLGLSLSCLFVEVNMKNPENKPTGSYH